MADAKSNETSSSDPKAAPRSGAVRPPVLEGTARPAEGEAAGKAPAGSAAADKPATPKPETPRAGSAGAPTETRSGGGQAWLAGLLGGVLGLGAAYGLAFFGYWPAVPAQPQPADPRLSQFATVIPELQSTTGRVQDELATLTRRFGTMEETIANMADTPAASADAGLAAQLAALSERVEALAAAPDAGADTLGEANAAEIAVLAAQLAQVQQQVAEAAVALEETRARIAALDGEFNEGQAADLGAARLPLILSGLETAFAGGRPFAGELAALRQALPEAEIPAEIANAAPVGLPRPDVVVRQASAALPDMLAGRPLAAGADWGDAAADWFRGIIALRPAEAVEGDGPDAVAARFEAALAQRDFAAAQAELEQLPEPMRAAAGAVAADIALLARAEALLDELRAAALATGSGA